MKHLFTLFLFLTSVLTMNAQSVSLFDVDASGFPTVKAKFYAFDAANKQQRPSKSELTITENGQPRTITSVTCPPDTIKSLSVCIMVDTYGYGLIKLAQAGTQRLINYLKPPKDEIAITMMNKGVQIHQDFTSDMAKATLGASSIPPAPGYVDVQKMFYFPYTGGVPFISERTADKKVLILVSDLHCPNLNLDTARLYQDAAKYNISVYTVLLGTSDYSGLFKRVAAKTGGKVFELVKTETQIENIFQEIDRREHYFPCEITWESVVTCQAGFTNVELTWQTKKAQSNYLTPASAIASLKVTPTSVSLGKRLPSTQTDTTLTLAAQNADFTVTGISRKYGSAEFTVVNTTFPISITKNASKTITLRFAPSDSALKYASFEISTDKCPCTFSTYGGFPEKKMTASTLKLTKPNGGEVFAVGSDTLITWEGIAPTDTVSLEFSLDNGATWKLLSTEATGLKYAWKNVPKPPSAMCLVMVKQGDTEQGASHSIEWQKSLGGSGYDAANSIQQSADGGYIVAGYNASTYGDVSGNHGAYDYWVVKLSPAGGIVWQKSLGGSGDDVAYSIQQSADGGYIMAGYSQSNNGDVIGNHGSWDYWVVKLSSIGAVEWQKSLGGGGDDVAYSIQQSTDGGYIVAGYSDSKNSDVTGNHGLKDYWVVKLSPVGAIEWQKSLGGRGDDVANSIQQSIDGGYIVAGFSFSKDGDVSGNHGGNDSWVVKLSPAGALEWQKSLGGIGGDRAQSIQQSTDGGYIVAGFSDSNDGDVTGNYGGNDYWVVKLSPLGDVEWQKSLGGSGSDAAHSIQQSTDGGYIVAGYTNSKDGDVTGNHGGSSDSWVVKLSLAGALEWQKSLGGSGKDVAYSIQQSADDGYIVAGFSDLNNGDVTGNHGNDDYWVVKLSPDGVVLKSDTSDAVFSIIAPEPTLQNLSIDMGKVLVGQSKDSTVLEIVCNKGLAPLHVLGIDITSGDSTDFSIPRGAGDFFLDSNKQCQDVMFGFAPTKVGKWTAKATVRTTIGNFIDTITITGEGIAPALAIVNPFIDFGKTLVGIPKDSTKVVTIKNVGTSDLTIVQTDYNAVNTANFSTLSGGNSFILKPSKEAIMDLRFLPNDVGRRSGILQFHYSGVGSPATVQLFGEGIINIPDTARTTVIAQDITAQAGEKVNLSLKLFKPTRMDVVGAPTDWYARIHYNKSILFNEQPSNVCQGTTDSCVLELTGVYNPKSDELISIPCIATLGNTDHSSIVIDEFKWTNSAIATDVATQNGTITITGTCEDGGVRLFIPAKSSTSLATRPNPAQDNLQIQYGLREPLTVTLELLTMTGQVVQTIVNNQAQAAGQYTLTNDLHLLGNGVYLLRLRTNKDMLTTRVDVVR